MKRIDIKIRYFCNNSCIFCVQEGNKEKYGLKELSFSQIKGKLEKGRKNSAEEVIFTGGEPSLNFPLLLFSIKYAKKIGYKSIYLQTNGRIYSYRKNAKMVAKSGVNRATISIHGSSSEKHDTLTQTKNSFDQAVQGIKNLKEEGVEVSINSVIVKKNIADLENIAQLAVDLRVSQIQFAFIHISTAILMDDRRLKNVAPKKSEVILPLLKALVIAENKGIEAKTEGIPFCLMKGNEKYIGDSNKRLPETSVFEYEKDVINFKKVLLSKGRAKREQCKECKYFKLCVGPWAEYPDIFGWEEFIPVK
jgi:MoaA/NifB/PqqE/SkfB family radical SAM enzyme